MHLFMKINSDITRQGRVIGYDIARSFALFYMVFVNFWAMLHDYNIPERVDSFFLKIQGKAAVTFIVLAGIGLSLLSKHAYIGNDYTKKRALRNKLFKRAFFLFMLGFLNTYIWLADILHFYAIFIMISPFFLYASNKKLWAYQFISIIAFIILMTWDDDIT